MLETLSKAYVYKNLFTDAAKLLGRTFNNLDIDKERWLGKVGLQTYTPTRNVFGGLGIFALGALAGGVVALALAPKAGSELRSDVKEKALSLLDSAEAATSASPTSRSLTDRAHA